MLVIPPEKRLHYYVSHLVDSKKTNVRFHAHDVQIVSMDELENDEGCVVRAWIPHSSTEYDMIQKIEDFVFDTVSMKHKEWFKLEMSQDKLRQYFRSCIDTHGVATIYVSSIKTPRLRFNGQDIDDITNVRDFKRKKCECEFEVSGVYFYPKKFGIKLMLRSMEINDNNRRVDEHEEGCVHVDKEAVEQEWENEIEAFSASLDSDVELLQRKLVYIDELRQRLRNTLQNARCQPECTKCWNDSLESLRSMIFKYKSGCLL